MLKISLPNAWIIVWVLIEATAVVALVLHNQSLTVYVGIAVAAMVWAFLGLFWGGDNRYHILLVPPESVRDIYLYDFEKEARDDKQAIGAWFLLICLIAGAVAVGNYLGSSTADGFSADYTHQSLRFTGAYSETKVFKKNGELVQQDTAWARAPIRMTKPASPEMARLWHQYFDITHLASCERTPPPARSAVGFFVYTT